MRKLFLPTCLLVSIVLPQSVYPHDDFKTRVENYQQIDVPLNTPLVQYWREPLISWAYNVTEHIDLHPICVSAGSEIFDRFLLKSNIPSSDITQYFTNSLILAIKFYEKDVSLNMFAKLSGNMFTSSQLRKSESHVLQTLNWKIPYITPETYVQEYFGYLFECGGHFSGKEEFLNMLKMDCLWQSRNYVYKSKGPFTSHHIATNNIIDVMQKMQIPEIDKFYLYQTLGYLFGSDI